MKPQHCRASGTIPPNTRINHTWAKLSYSKRRGCEELEERNQLDQPRSTRRKVLDLGPGKGLSPGHQLEGASVQWSLTRGQRGPAVAPEKARMFRRHRSQGAVGRSRVTPCTQAFPTHLLLQHYFSRVLLSHESGSEGTPQSVGISGALSGPAREQSRRVGVHLCKADSHCRAAETKAMV